MKVLINADFKALRTGKFVVANEEAGEFIFNSKDVEDLSIATLLEIGKANKIKVKKGKKGDVVDTLVEGIEELELAVVSEKPISLLAEEIVAAGVEAGESDEEMQIKIVQAGAKFKQAGKLFNQAMASGGFRVTAKERKANIRTVLVEAEFQPETSEEVSKMVARLEDELNDVNASQANAGIRAYAREFEIEIPKPEKKPKGGFKIQVQNHVIENPEITKEEFAEFCEDKVKDVEQKVRTMWPAIEFAQKVGAAMVEVATAQ